MVGVAGGRAFRRVEPAGGPSLGVLGDVAAFVFQVSGVANYVVVVVALPDGWVRVPFIELIAFVTTDL